MASSTNDLQFGPSFMRGRATRQPSNHIKSPPPAADVHSPNANSVTSPTSPFTLGTSTTPSLTSFGSLNHNGTTNGGGGHNTFKPPSFSAVLSSDKDSDDKRMSTSLLSNSRSSLGDWASVVKAKGQKLEYTREVLLSLYVEEQVQELPLQLDPSDPAVSENVVGPPLALIEMTEAELELFAGPFNADRRAPHTNKATHHHENGLVHDNKLPSVPRLGKRTSADRFLNLGIQGGVLSGVSGTTSNRLRRTRGEEETDAESVLRRASRQEGFAPVEQWQPGLRRPKDNPDGWGNSKWRRGSVSDDKASEVPVQRYSVLERMRERERAALSSLDTSEETAAQESLDPLVAAISLNPDQVSGAYEHESSARQPEKQETHSNAVLRPPPMTQDESIESVPWQYQDPSGTVQGPFTAFQMQEWYKASFFRDDLLVKRASDPTFQTLETLIFRVGDRDKPFYAKPPPALPPNLPPPSIPMASIPSPRDSPLPHHVNTSMPIPGRHYPDHNVSPFSSGFDNQSSLSSMSAGGLGQAHAGHPDPWSSSPPNTISPNMIPWQAGVPPHHPMFNHHNPGYAAPFGHPDPLMYRQAYPNDNLPPHHESVISPSHVHAFGTQPFSQPGFISPSFLNAQHPFPGEPSHLEQGDGRFAHPQHHHFAPPPAQDERFIDGTWHHQHHQGILEHPSHSVLKPTSLDQNVGDVGRDVPQFMLRQATDIGIHHDSVANEARIAPIGPRSSGKSSPASRSSVVSRADFAPVNAAILQVLPAAPVADPEEEVLAEPVPAPITLKPEVSAEHSASPASVPIVQSKLEVPFLETKAKEKKGALQPDKPQKSTTTSRSSAGGKVTVISRAQLEEQTRRAASFAKTQQQLRVAQAQERAAKEEAAAAAAAAGNVTAPVSAAPWSIPDDAKSSSGPSLAEIQALEAKDADKRRAVEKQLAAHRLAAESAAATEKAVKEAKEGLPTTSTWATSVSTTGIARPSPSPGPWSKDLTDATPKQSMQQIQEEEAKKKSAATKSAALAKSAYSSQLSPSAAKLNTSTLVTTGPWSVVGAKGRTTTPVPQASSQSSPVTSLATRSSTPTLSSPATATAPRNASAAAAAAPLVRPANLPAKPVSSASTVTESLPAPSPDFMKWLRDALKGMNNVDDFIKMLLDFPINPDDVVLEIISDSVYAGSATLDGRRFAREFKKRRSSDVSNRWNKTTINPANATTTTTNTTSSLSPSSTLSSSLSLASSSSTVVKKPSSMADAVKSQPQPANAGWGFAVVTKKKKR